MCKKVENDNYPFVSIIVLNWNGKSYLEKCLRSLMSLTYPNYEVIVVDNGSFDGSPLLVKKEFRGVKLIINDTNLGFAKGNNIGIRASGGNMIVLLNNDVVVEPIWLSELVKGTAVSGRIGMAGGIALQGKPRNAVWSAGGRIDAFTGYQWRIGYGKRLEQVRETEDIDYLSGCALLVKREVAEKIGLLDEGYFFFGEDADWALRARRAGYECKLVRSAIVWHEGSATSRQLSKKRYYFYNVSTFRFLFKNSPLKYLFNALFFRLILLSVFEVFVFRCSPSYLFVKFRAFAWSISNLRETMLERKKVERFGDLNLRTRLRECLGIAKVHASSRYHDF